MVFTCTGRRALACVGGAAGSPGCQAELWWTFPQEGVFCLGERQDDHLAYLGACGASAALTVSSPTPCQSVPEQDTGGWIPSISGVAEIALLTWLSYQMCLPCFQSWIQKDIYLAHVFMGLFIEWLCGRRCSYLLCPLITSQITQSNSELWLGLNSQKNVSQSKILGTSFLPSKLMKKSDVVVRSH